MLHDDGKQPLQNSDFIFIQPGIDSHIQTGACFFWDTRHVSYINNTKIKRVNMQL